MENLDGILPAEIEEVHPKIKELQEKGFTIKRRVKRIGDKDGEVGEIIGYNHGDSRWPIQVKFPSGTFGYTETDLEKLRVRK